MICEKELQGLLGDRLYTTLTRSSRSEAPGYHHGRIDRELLDREIDDIPTQIFYVCGPPDMVEDLQEALQDLGADSEGVVVEE